ncbi:sulfatase family protein [Paenibacillus cremeus]|uniref:Sulfatase-like hydrolase/transferase n=1 Tax=Paenibacillus cremeus TaxID=2163881 RepID=A0A559KGR7_9BACL|nr:sulfatase-like hydrolase/transferase [Paenibacillus cremeus]TVY11311.1 sulfatase-like hydrolase/transferase [Paenibacillus cremeus]
MKRPNIVLIYTDQQRWDALGVNGNTEIITPNLDRLAKQGVNFNRYFVNNPLCMPSRVSMLTGQYPSTLKITHMGVPVPDSTVTVAHMLKNYGYITANIGKLHFLPHANRDHRTVHPCYGFDHLEISDEPGSYEDAYRAWVRRKAPEELDKISLGLPPAAAVWQKTMGVQDGIVHPVREPRHAQAFASRDDLTHSAFVSEQTIEFIEQHQNETFMCIAGFYSPHAPWIVPQTYLDLYDQEKLSLPQYPEDINSKRTGERFSDEELRSVKHGYYAMITEVDHYVGKIMEKLESLGIADNTLVVFTSDHGEFLGEYLRYGKGYPAPDCVSRVPLIMSCPQGSSAHGTTTSQLVEGVDIVPTLLEAAGIPMHPQLQGQSVFGVLSGQSVKEKACVITEFHQWKSIRTDRFRYIAEVSGKESLFDLERSALEYENLAEEAEYQEVIAEMRGLLLKKLLQIEAPLPRDWAY